jgi:hypothetical protein
VLRRVVRIERDADLAIHAEPAAQNRMHARNCASIALIFL